MTDMLIRDVPDAVIAAVAVHRSPTRCPAVWMSAAAPAHDAPAEQAMTITAPPRQECAAMVLGEPTTVLDIGRAAHRQRSDLRRPRAARGQSRGQRGLPVREVIVIGTTTRLPTASPRQLAVLMMCRAITAASLKL
jgi:hypothetical protein